MSSEHEAALEIFISYSHEDEEHREVLETHLGMMKRHKEVCVWHDRRIVPGQSFEDAIHQHIEAANVIVFLVSPDFLASDYCWDVEMTRALQRQQVGEAQILPVIVRPCEWDKSPFSHLQVLPKNGRPVTQWDDRDEPWLDVARGIRELLRGRRIAALRQQLDHLEALRELLGPEITDEKKATLGARIRELEEPAAAESSPAPPREEQKPEVDVPRTQSGRAEDLHEEEDGAAATNNMIATARRYLEALQFSKPAGDLESATASYLRYIQERHRYLSLKGLGIHDRVPLRLPLLDLFVPLRARLGLPEGDTWGREPYLAGRKAWDTLSEKPRDILEFLQQHSGMIILGDPGTGKTTFLKFLALKLALGRGDIPELSHRLPFLVPLSGYANALVETGVRLDAYIAEHFHQLGADLPMREIQARALEKGLALVLLDGLDEVKDPDLRHMVVERVIDFYSFHREAGNKFVLTSRVVGYREVRPTAQGLIECTLVDFEKPEIEEFVTKWTWALERQARGKGAVAASEAEFERDALLEAVHRIEGVGRLASNPLLLTILALMKRQGVTLPERRVELFEQYIRTLLSSWNRARGLGRPPSLDLDVVQTVRILAPLALWMHQVSAGMGLVRREELTRKLEALFAERVVADPEDAARRLLADIHQHTSLLLERGPGEYGFIHLTFEEYLAAIAIILKGQQDVEPIVTTLKAHAEDPAWREVSRLSVGYLGIIQQREEAAGVVVEALAECSVPRHTAILAGEAVLDAWPGGVPPKSKQRVTEALIVTMQDAAEAPGLRRRAGLLLGELEWLPPDLDEFLEVPPGRFLYGDDKVERQIEDRYWIGKYPVTIAQYDRFITEGGYRSPKLWSPEGWKWRWKNDRQVPSLWNNPEFNNPILPVVGVAWFEAQAYCNWLDLRHQAEALPGLPQAAAADKLRNYAIRLPSEDEWQRAARGTEGQEYPSGDDLDTSQGNTQECDSQGRGLGTTAVCTYPQGVSPAGVWDMGGNIWEWMSSRYELQRTYYLAKGGSCYSIHEFSRGAFCYGDEPSGGSDLMGFRVIFGPKIVPRTDLEIYHDH